MWMILMFCKELEMFSYLWAYYAFLPLRNIFAAISFQYMVSYLGIVLLPPAYGILLCTACWVDSHLLVLVVNLLLISVLLYFGELLWNFIMYLLSECFSYLCAFSVIFWLFFLFHHFVSFLVILYHLLMFWGITLSGLYRILR